jgi:hypothetical protein
MPMFPYYNNNSNDRDSKNPMKTITQEKIGARYIIDGNREVEVKLDEILPDGWVRVLYPENRLVNIEARRLTEILEVPPTKKKEEAKQEAIERITDEIVKYPVQVSRLEIELKDDEGKVIIRSIEGEDAEKWSKWMRDLCMEAEGLKKNPPFYTLGWIDTPKT